MKKIQPGSRILIYLLGVISILSTKLWLILAAGGFFLLTLQLIQRNGRKIFNLLLKASPFLLTASLLGFFHQQGFHFAGLLSIRLFLIILWNGMILADLREPDLILGLEQLHCPRLLSVTIFFILRYSQLIGSELKRLILARKLRGGKTADGWFNIKQYLMLSQVLGAVLLRTLDKGERTYTAMRLRGLKTNTLVRNNYSMAGDSWILLVSLIITAVIIIINQKGVLL